MSRVGLESRSYLPIGKDDLEKLLEIAQRDIQTFFENHPRWTHLYSNRIICIALCQGAAKHYIDGKTGINDFDVYTFFEKHPSKAWYAKRIKSYDFGNPKFGQSPDRPNFVGRRIDCLGRGIDLFPNDDVYRALRRYMTAGKTKTAQLLSQKAVILLQPDLGRVVWPLMAAPF